MNESSMLTCFKNIESVHLSKDVYVKIKTNCMKIILPIYLPENTNSYRNQVFND